jgi:hypothetical protein
VTPERLAELQAFIDTLKTAGIFEPAHACP